MFIVTLFIYFVIDSWIKMSGYCSTCDREYGSGGINGTSIPAPCLKLSRGDSFEDRVLFGYPILEWISET